MPSICNEIIDDIEDLISSQDITPKERYSNKKNVTVRVKKAKNVILDRANDGYEAPCSIIPGTQTIYIKTWGCTHNSSDSEYMAGQLSSYGYTLTSKLLLPTNVVQETSSLVLSGSFLRLKKTIKV